MDPWQACLRLDPVNDEMVSNGISYERAVVDFSMMRGLVVPHDAVIRRGLPADRFNVYVEKQQKFSGWPEKKLAIADQRGYMGVAYRLNGQVVAFATYGEWGNVEGGGQVRLSFIVPADLDVRRREDLSGAHGMANTHVAGSIGPGSGHPKVGWTVLATEPNVEAIRI